MAKNKFIDQRFLTNGVGSSLANKLNLKKYITDVSAYKTYTVLMSHKIVVLNDNLANVTPINTVTGDETVLLENNEARIPAESEVLELVIGNEYLIEFLQEGDDFSNVGYESDNIPFIATGTTPTSWVKTSVIDLTNSQPSVIILEDTIKDVKIKYGIVTFDNNTLPEEETFELSQNATSINKSILGLYIEKQNGFISEKIMMLPYDSITKFDDSILLIRQSNLASTTPIYTANIPSIGDNTLDINQPVLSNSYVNFPIEIRIYN